MKVDRKRTNQSAGIGVMVFSVVVVFLVLGVYLSGYVDFDRESKLSAVQFVNGDIYFGEISYFPRLTLRNAYTIQVSADPENPSEPAYQFVPLENSIWAPDKIYLNYDNIVLIGEVGEDSQVMQIINQQRNQ